MEPRQPADAADAADFKARYDSDASIRSDIDALLDFLPYSEYDLIAFMAQQGAWQGALPPPPTGWTPKSGRIELSLFLYWIKNPNLLDLTPFPFKTQMEILALCATLDTLSPASLMTAQNYQFLSTGELIYTDGSVLSTEKYATYDQGWFIAFLNLAKSVLYDLWYSGDDFPTTPPPVIPLAGAQPNQLSIAILGDAGTGDDTYGAVMAAIGALKPDYIIHVGDVYYAGPAGGEPNGTDYFASGEESQNLLAGWPAGYTGRSFTLNSNHEMYSGANGYFYDLLGVLKSIDTTPFTAQRNSSCFALQYGGWTLLGLDSAYMGTSADAFMTGTIGGIDGTQGKWISRLNPDPNKTIVLTHHNGIAPDCSAISPLWPEISGAFKGDPYAWYWGHVHNGIVYDRPLTIPPSPPLPGMTTNTFARCLGHAALPYGNSTELNGKPIAWRARNTQPAPSKQLYNGFAILVLQKAPNGPVTSISEYFYDLSQEEPVYSTTMKL